jgi:peptidoglycan/LPS O-acetylase OafA/YrhL
MVALDGLRGLLCVYVVLGHALLYAPVPAWLRGVAIHGHAAVDLFFALSGLVILLSLERHGFRAGPFLRARARRILPVYWLVLGFACAVIAVHPSIGAVPWSGAPQGWWADGLPHPFWAHLLAHLVLVQGMLPDAVLPYSWVTLLGAAWSLSTEAQFYVVMAAIGRRARPAALVVLLLAAAVLFRLLVPHLGAAWRFSRAFLPAASAYFALGIASRGFLREGRGAPLLLAALVAMALGLLDAPGKAVPPLIWLAVMMALRGAGYLAPLARLLAAPPLRWLGAISYPLYLVNEPVQRALVALLGPLAGGDPHRFTLLWLPPALILPVIAAGLLHQAVERPLMAPGASPRGLFHYRRAS